MGLVTLDYVLAKARRGKYAVGGFNFFSLENLQGIAEGAARQNSPVIAMASTGAMKLIGEKTTVAIARSIAEEYGIQMVLHLDHCTDMELLMRCVDNGFTSVMIDASSKPYQENVDITAEAVEYARKYGCSVEAELGHVGGQEDEITVDERTAMFTREVTKQLAVGDFHRVAVEDAQRTAVLVVVQSGLAVLEAAVVEPTVACLVQSNAIPAAATKVKEMKPCGVGHGEDN